MILKASKNIKNCRLCNTNKLLTVYDLGSTHWRRLHQKINLGAKKYDLKLKKMQNL